jgi:hypothetical protein
MVFVVVKSVIEIIRSQRGKGVSGQKTHDGHATTAVLSREDKVLLGGGFGLILFLAVVFSFVHQPGIEVVVVPIVAGWYITTFLTTWIGQLAHGFIRVPLVSSLMILLISWGIYALAPLPESVAQYHFQYFAFGILASLLVRWLLSRGREEKS